MEVIIRLLSNLIFKQVFIFALYLFLIIPFDGLGQGSSNEISEKEIKTSGLYYWGQSMDLDIEQSKLNARDDLMLSISKEISDSPELNSKSDIFVKEIGYFVKEIGSKYKTVAFVKKSSVSNIDNQDQQMDILQLQFSEKDPVSTENKTENVSQLMEIEKQNIYPGDLEIPPLLSKAITYENINELFLFLKSENRKGLLVYSSNQETFISSPETIYRIIFDTDTGEVLAIVDTKASPQINIINNSVFNDSELKSKKYTNLWSMLL